MWIKLSLVCSSVLLSLISSGRGLKCLDCGEYDVHNLGKTNPCELSAPETTVDCNENEVCALLTLELQKPIFGINEVNFRKCLDSKLFKTSCENYSLDDINPKLDEIRKLKSFECYYCEKDECNSDKEDMNFVIKKESSIKDTNVNTTIVTAASTTTTITATIPTTTTTATTTTAATTTTTAATTSAATTTPATIEKGKATNESSKAVLREKLHFAFIFFATLMSYNFAFYSEV